MSSENKINESPNFVTIKQKLNPWGQGGIVLIIFSLIVVICVYFAQLKEIETIARSIRYGGQPSAITDYTLAYLGLGAANLLGLIFIIIGRDFYYPKQDKQ